MKNSDCPLIVLESAVFFIHKKKDKNHPNNYRSITIQNALMKLMTTILSKRLSTWAENNNKLPTFQFEYRKSHSTSGAAMVLKEVILSRINIAGRNSLKIYVCHIDFFNCFDSIDRELLFSKLQTQGVPYKFCKLIGFIYKNTQNYIINGTFLANPVKLTARCPQGCGLSAICFSLFVADLPNCLLN